MTKFYSNWFQCTVYLHGRARVTFFYNSTIYKNCAFQNSSTLSRGQPQQGQMPISPSQYSTFWQCLAVWRVLPIHSATSSWTPQTSVFWSQWCQIIARLAFLVRCSSCRQLLCYFIFQQPSQLCSEHASNVVALAKSPVTCASGDSFVHNTFIWVFRSAQRLVA